MYNIALWKKRIKLKNNHESEQTDDSNNQEYGEKKEKKNRE